MGAVAKARSYSSQPCEAHAAKPYRIQTPRTVQENGSRPGGPAFRMIGRSCRCDGQRLVSRIATDCRWRRRRRVMPRSRLACRLDLRSNPLIAIDPVSIRLAAPTRGRRSGLHGDGVAVRLPDNRRGRRAAPFRVRSLAHAYASSASEGCSAQDLSRSWPARARQHDRHEHGGDDRRADNRHGHHGEPAYARSWGHVGEYG